MTTDKAILFGGELIRAFDNGDGTFALAAGAICYGTAKSGELAGTAIATQLPNVTCRLARFKGRIDNAGNVYLGGVGVTLPNGATDATTGMEVLPGEDSGWLPVSNLNVLYRICDNAGDDLTYLCLE